MLSDIFQNLNIGGTNALIRTKNEFRDFAPPHLTNATWCYRDFRVGTFNLNEMCVPSPV